MLLAISFKFEGGHDASDYSIRGSIKKKVPGRPAYTTKAIHEQEQTGEDHLFVRASGSDALEPRQMKLATDDGKAIDPTTGEIIEPKTNAKPRKES